MAYRVTKRSAEQKEAMRRGKDAKRMAEPPPDYPAILPELRREIIIVDHDFGRREHNLKLYRTNRVDCYRVEVDGKPWKARIGWARILEGLRKSLPRVGSV